MFILPGLIGTLISPTLWLEKQLLVSMSLSRFEGGRGNTNVTAAAVTFLDFPLFGIVMEI